MKLRSLFALCISMYIICGVATVFVLISSIANLMLSHGEKFLCAFVIFALGFMAARLLCVCKPMRAEKIMRVSFVWLFIVYVLVVIDFTLVSESFGRSISNIFNLSLPEVRQYIRENTNIVPFATVRLYINGLRAGNIMPYIVAENLLGNFLVFMPFAFFVPATIKGINSAWRFLNFIACAVAVIELLQIVFLTGSADVDDFILNVAGAMAAYGILQIGVVRKNVSRLTRGCYNIANKS